MGVSMYDGCKEDFRSMLKVVQSSVNPLDWHVGGRGAAYFALYLPTQTVT